MYTWNQLPSIGMIKSPDACRQASIKTPQSTFGRKEVDFIKPAVAPGCFFKISFPSFLGVRDVSVVSDTDSRGSF